MFNSQEMTHLFEEEKKKKKKTQTKSLPAQLTAAQRRWRAFGDALKVTSKLKVWRSLQVVFYDLQVLIGILTMYSVHIIEL